MHELYNGNGNGNGNNLIRFYIALHQSYGTFRALINALINAAGFFFGEREDLLNFLPANVCL